MNAGCRRFRWNVTRSKPSGTTLSRLAYQVLRGLTRSFSAPRPSNKSQVHLTSAAVNGFPSCHLTPGRRLKLRPVPAASHDQSVAKSGTIEASPLRGTAWSYMTRLLKTPIIGPCPAMVASSWIDMLAGLSKK